MIEALIGNEFWQQIVRFLFGSSILLLAVWGLELSGLIKRFETRAYLWKVALLGSVLMLLPVSLPQAPVYTFQTLTSVSTEPAVYDAEPMPASYLQPPTLADSYQLPAAEVESPSPEAAVVGSVRPATATSAQGSRSSWMQAVSIWPTRILENLIARPLSSWMLWLWMLGSGIALLRLFLGYRRGMQQLGLRNEYAQDDPVFTLFKGLCAEAGLTTTPKLTRSIKTTSPVTLLGNEICLPEWVDQSLPEAELRSLLAHEIGHIRHHDLRLLLGLQLLSCLFFFQPLFLLARNRLMDLSEFLADQSALDQCRNSNAISRALVNCADRMQSQNAIRWGFAMVGNTSRLKMRIQELQTAGKKSVERLSWLGRSVLLATVSLAVLLVPTLRVESAAASADSPEPSAIQQALENESLLLDDVATTIELIDTFVSEIDVVRDELIQQDEISASDQEQAREILENEVNSLREQLASQREEIRLQQAEPSQLALPEQLIPLPQPPEPVQAVQLPELPDSVVPVAAVTPIPAIAVPVVDVNVNTSTRVETTTTVQRSAQPGLTGFLDLFRTNRRNSNSYSVRNDLHEWEWDEGEARWENEFTTNDSEDEIVAITGNGYFTYRSDDVRPQRQIRFEADGNGVSTTYSVDGDEVAFDADGRQWFNEVLVTLFRSTGVNAGERVDRMLDNDGPDAVITELTFIGSDLVSRIYNSALLENATLSEEEILNLLETNKSIGSDIEMRVTLSKLVETQTLGEASQSRLFDVVRSIGSDLETRVTLSNFVEEVAPSAQFTNALLGATASIGSDLESRVVLRRIVENGIMDDANWLAFRNATKTMGSDLEVRVLLSAAAEKPGITTQATMNLIEATASIGSDLEMRVVLPRLVEHGVMDDANWRAVFDALDTVGSDLEMRVLLGKLISLAPDSELVAELALHSLDTVGSDLEMRSAIRTIVENGSLADDSWQLALSQVESHIDNRLQRRSALRAIADNMPEDNPLRDEVQSRIDSRR